MPQKYTPYIDERWIRHDWRLWIQPNIERWMKPGVDPADVIPALARERAQQEAARQRARAAEHAELAAEIEHERRVLAALNEEMKEVNAEMARRRRRLAEEAKYSPSQPRIPKRNPGGGQWTRIGGAGQSPSSNIAKPMGNVDAGDVRGSSELGDLFQVKPTDPSRNGEQVAGDVIRVCIVIGAGRSTVDGVKTFSVIYECAGGRTFRKQGFGHNFPGIVRDPFR
jgi:hypothetical protein